MTKPEKIKKLIDDLQALHDSHEAIDYYESEIRNGISKLKLTKKELDNIAEDQGYDINSWLQELGLHDAIRKT